MLPILSERRRSEFKSRRRRIEFERIAASLRPWLRGDRRPRILEFGCGPAGGAGSLSGLGALIESDVYRHPGLALPPGVPFLICDMKQAPFRSGQFDLIVSNHVIEHIDRLEQATEEMNRIAADGAVFAFAVPTAIWLLQSVPGQVWKKVENVAARIFGRRASPMAAAAARAPEIAGPAGAAGDLLRKLGLEGHGVYPRFFECLRALRVARWRERLHALGFATLAEERLLSYGSAHWPVLPTSRTLARIGISSSHLFILRSARASQVLPGRAEFAPPAGPRPA